MSELIWFLGGLFVGIAVSVPVSMWLLHWATAETVELPPLEYEMIEQGTDSEP